MLLASHHSENNKGFRGSVSETEAETKYIFLIMSHNYSQALKPNQGTPICLAGFQNCYDPVGSFVSLLFPSFWMGMSIAVILCLFCHCLLRKWGLWGRRWAGPITCLISFTDWQVEKNPGVSSTPGPDLDNEIFDFEEMLHWDEIFKDLGK